MDLSVEKGIKDLVTISIVTHNSAHIIKKCLDAIPVTIPIVIYDNKSTDDTLDCISNDVHHFIKIIASKKNIGFGPAHNINALNIKTKYLLVLNPDCFITEQSLYNLIKTAEANPKSAVVGPSYKQDEIHAFTQTVNFISGACMLLRMAVFKEIGFFDSNIFLYFEDDELCQRAQRKGYELLIAPNTLVTHLRRSSCINTKKLFFLRAFYYGRSEAYFFSKDKLPSFAKHLAIIKLQLRYLKRFFKKLLERHYPYSKEYIIKFLGVSSYHFTVKKNN